MRILIVEDDRKTASLLARGLQEEGFVVDIAHSAEHADELSFAVDYDLIVIDWLLREKDGLALCRDLRGRGVQTPIIMLTARDALTDRVTGLNTGADDYLTKPFAFDELIARIRALLRRSGLTRPVVLKFADVSLDPVSHEVTRADQPLVLTPKEYAILELLMRHAGDVVDRSRLADRIWECDLRSLDNLIDVHISNLRKKVDAIGPPLIQTVRGRGYRLA
jgi:DNA-binding response OmpR family regulator